MSKIKGKYIEFNDAGTGTTDVWSADKIISYVDAFNPFDQDLNTTDDVEFNRIVSKDIAVSRLQIGNFFGGLFGTEYPLISGSSSLKRLYFGYFSSSVYNVYAYMEKTGEFKFNEQATFIRGLQSDTTLDVDGAVDFGSTLNVDGAVDFNSTLTIDGLTTIYNNLDVQDDLDVGGTITGNVTGNVTGDLTGNLTGATTVSGYLTVNSRLLLHESTIGNSSSPTLGSGNYFVHTYTSLIRINANGWTAGSVIVLGFSDNCDVYSSYSASGTFQGIRLQGTTTFSAKAGDTLTLINDGTYWRETSRMVV